MRILILGVTGMLGSAMFRLLSVDPRFEIYGSVRSETAKKYFDAHLQQQIICGVDVEHHDSLVRVFGTAKPEIVINCIGLVKQVADVKDPLQAIPINTLLPHRLAALCAIGGTRLIHISTDCVFSGTKGGYSEADFPDADDLYGRSKLLGEVDYSHAITLRTSIIGHELAGHRSLIGWFLSQEKQVKGYSSAVFSGLPTVELSRVVRDFVLPHGELRGVYHVAASPINKFDLLTLVADVYGKTIEVIPDESLVIDRSLDSSRFRLATGYQPKAWLDLVRSMHEFH